MSVEITKADEVIGNGVGAVMQVREVLRILQQHPQRPKDLEDKVLHLAAKIIESVGMASFGNCQASIGIWESLGKDEVNYLSSEG